MSPDDFTPQPWCDHCETGNCSGEHGAFITSVPATGGSADQQFKPMDDSIEVPSASVHLMFSEHPQDMDDAPFIALQVTDGSVMLRPHEAMRLVSKITDAAIVARRSSS